MFELIAQTAPAPEAGLLQLMNLALSGGSLAVTFVLGWYFINRHDALSLKHDAKIEVATKECKEEREKNTIAFLGALEKQDKENKEFVSELADRCHEVHKESTSALREANRTLTRNTWVQEKLVAKFKLIPPADDQFNPSDSTIVQQNDEFERRHQK